MSLRVVIADDDELTRGGIRLVLAALPGVEVVGEVSNGKEARSAVDRLKPDVILMDIRMPIVDGLAALRAIPGSTKVIMLTTFGEEQYIDDALAHGAAGFVLKSSAAEELGPALRAAAAGEMFLSPPVTRHAVTRLRGLGAPVVEGADRLSDLSDREIEVLKLLARGLSNTAISGSLVISESTVKTHVSRILLKLECENRVQAALIATQAGLLN